MHKNHGDFQKLSVIVKDSKSQVQNDKVLLLFNLSKRIFVLIFRLVVTFLRKVFLAVCVPDHSMTSVTNLTNGPLFPI